MELFKSLEEFTSQTQLEEFISKYEGKDRVIQFILKDGYDSEVTCHPHDIKNEYISHADGLNHCSNASSELVYRDGVKLKYSVASPSGFSEEYSEEIPLEELKKYCKQLAVVDF